MWSYSIFRLRSVALGVILLGIAFSPQAFAAHYVINPETGHSWSANEIWLRINSNTQQIVEVSPNASIGSGKFRVNTWANFHCAENHRLYRVMIESYGIQRGDQIGYEKRSSPDTRHYRRVPFDNFPFARVNEIANSCLRGATADVRYTARFILRAYCKHRAVLFIEREFDENYWNESTSREVNIRLICDPNARAMTRTDRPQGEAAPARRQCKQGFVWREAGPTDFICVDPDIRTMARQENARASSRVVSGSDRCTQGFVWREAFPGDKVCVTPESREQAQRDNQAHASRVASP